MRLDFRAKWFLTDDEITFLDSGSPISVKICEIKEVKEFSDPGFMTSGSFWLYFYEPHFWGAMSTDHKVCFFSKKEVDEAEEAFEYISEHCGSRELEEKQKRIEAAVEKTVNREYRMRCGVCGKVFCYNIDDILKNHRNVANAKLSAGMSLLSAIGGTELGMYANSAESEKYLSKIVDYSRCPNCNSTNISLLDDNDIDLKETDNTGVNVSVADEIKKYKELLDIGAITQEEFDSKKKQLLGL